MHDPLNQWDRFDHFLKKFSTILWNFVSIAVAKGPSQLLKNVMLFHADDAFSLELTPCQGQHASLKPSPMARQLAGLS